MLKAIDTLSVLSIHLSTECGNQPGNTNILPVLGLYLTTSPVNGVCFTKANNVFAIPGITNF